MTTSVAIAGIIIAKDVKIDNTQFTNSNGDSNGSISHLFIKVKSV